MSTVQRRTSGSRGMSRGTARASNPPRISAAPWIAFAGLILCFGVLGACVSGVFKVRTVQVVGRNLPAALVVQDAGVTGENIFTVNTDRVIDRLAAVPSIQVLKVETAFPSTVTIVARARLAVAAWQRGKTYTLLDAAGTPMGTAAATTLPAVTGNRLPSVGQVAAVRYALVTLPKQPDGRTSGFDIDARYGLQIVGASGWTANLGDGSSQAMVDRVAALANILGQMPARGQHLKDADLRFGQAVAHVVTP